MKVIYKSNLQNKIYEIYYICIFNTRGFMFIKCKISL